MGFFLRDLNDGIHGEIRIDNRVYRVKTADLRSAYQPSAHALVAARVQCL
jgi:hypothetical protein